MRPNLITRTAAAACLLLALGSASATTAVYNDFSSTDGLTLNGDAAQAGSRLRLVPFLPAQSGTAFLNEALTLDAGTGFQTHFKFHVDTNAGDPTDGFAFLLQNDGAGVNALGAGGQGLGYVGLTPSVAVVFRGRNPNLIGVITGGTDPADLPIPFQPPGFFSAGESDFYNQPMNAWIDYDAGSTTLKVYLSDTDIQPGDAVMTASVDLFGTLGTQAYVGFSAGNGGSFGDQDILNWQFTTTPVPEAGTAGMLALGLLSLGLMRRRAAR